MGDIRHMLRTDPRRAGAVQRYHTWPTIQTQSVAEASWNVARILVMIWPDAPAGAITHALLNDCGEISCGDLPFPVKRDNPALKSQIVRLETESMLEQGILHLATMEDLDGDIWLRRVKICDMLEMWEFGLEEMCLGSRYSQPIIEDTLTDIERLMDSWLENEDCKKIREYTEWRLQKTPAAQT